MFEIIAVTNRKLCGKDFLERVDAIAVAGVSAVILREKDLSPAAYGTLFSRVREVCEKRGTPLIAHGFAALARRDACDGLHLPLAAFEEYAEDRAARQGDAPPAGRIGVSVHSADEAVRAAACGASYAVAGHIFRTESKASLAPKGLEFLSEICERVSIPVYAIGGVSAENIAEIKRAGAAGACLMSSFMTCADPAALAAALRRALANERY
jgi:thiamine-phosphate pyrophosphorylase